MVFKVSLPNFALVKFASMINCKGIHLNSLLTHKNIINLLNVAYWLYIHFSFASNLLTFALNSFQIHFSFTFNSFQSSFKLV